MGLGGGKDWIDLSQVSGEGQVASTCKRGNELAGFIICRE